MNLYPKIFLETYEQKLYEGHKIAQKTSLLLVTKDPEKHHKIIDDLRWNFKEVQIEREEKCANPLILNIDRSIKCINIDGVLNSLQWLYSMKASHVYGSLCNTDLEILNYGILDTNYPGETIDWKPGNLPMRVTSWSNHLILKRQEFGPSYFNPSLIGII